jgi:hypothetical protein
MGLLQALLANESGGRNIANTTQGTSSGQAQGFFQITTGTWNDFGGQQYAPNPMQASYAQQAAIASKIPLKRWDESTVAKMQATGLKVDPNKTLGENLAANGEGFGAAPTARVSGPVEAAGGGGGNEAAKDAPQLYTPPVAAPPAAAADTTADAIGDLLGKDRDFGTPFSSLAKTLASVVSEKQSTGLSNAPNSPSLGVPNFERSQLIQTDMPEMTTAAPTGLANLFKVGDIGQAAALNVDQLGQPLRRRQYG